MRPIVTQTHTHTSVLPLSHCVSIPCDTYTRRHECSYVICTLSLFTIQNILNTEVTHASSISSAVFSSSHTQKTLTLDFFLNQGVLYLYVDSRMENIGLFCTIEVAGEGASSSSSFVSARGLWCCLLSEYCTWPHDQVSGV